MKHYALLLVLLVSTLQLSAQRGFTDSNIVGDARSAKTGEHLPFVTISVTKTQLGTSTDATGHYFLKNLPTGRLTLKASFVGYKSLEKTVDIVKGQTIELNFLLEDEAFSLNEVVVSANRNETQRRLAPTLVSVLDAKTFELTNASSLSQALNFEPGVRVENNCTNCGFSQVRINGLDGQYSQILIDSRPVFGALAGIYGLEQIPANMIERVEVIRGGGSALYGSSAIGGTINVITKEPSRSGASVGHTFAYLGGRENATENITSFNGSVISDDNKAGLMLFGQRRQREAYFRDADDFSEIPFLENRGFGFRSFYKPSAFAKISAEFHSMQEDRRGGDNLHLPVHEVDIAESLKHSVNGGNIKYDQFLADGHGRLSVFAAAQYVVRNSFYGGGKPIKEVEEDLERLIDISTGKLAKDTTVKKDIMGAFGAYGRSTDLTYQVGAQYAHNFDNLFFMPAELTVGTEYFYQDLYDETGVNRIWGDKLKPITQTIHNFSAFLQNEWRNDMWSFLLGGRFDSHNSPQGKNIMVFSPRANVRFNPTEDINLRLSYSEGFRAPQYFNEDLHTELAGNTAIRRVMSDGLKKETSRSISGSVDYYLNLGDNIKANFLAEGFYTLLYNRFETPDGDEDIDGIEIREIVNQKEVGTVAGVNLEGRFAFGKQLDLQLGATFQRSGFAKKVQVFGDLESEFFMKSPGSYSYFVLNYKPLKDFTATLSGKHTGSMWIVHEAYEDQELLAEGKVRGVKEDTLLETKPYFELSCRFAYDFSLSKMTKLQLNAGVQNIANVYQKDYDTGAGRVSSFSYGPSLPRSIFAGVKLSF